MPDNAKHRALIKEINDELYGLVNKICGLVVASNDEAIDHLIEAAKHCCYAQTEMTLVDMSILVDDIIVNN